MGDRATEIEHGHLLDYARILHKRRWAAAVVFIILVATVSAYTFTQPVIYEAQARLLIESEKPNVVQFKGVVEPDLTRTEYYLTAYTLLQSRTLAFKTIDQLGLWGRPELSTPGSGQTSLPAKQAEVIDAFLDRLTVVPVRNSRLVDVKFRFGDRRLAATVVNTIAQLYIEQDVTLRTQASREASVWLAEQLAAQRRQVEASESALQQYRERNDAIALVDRQNIVVQKLAELNAAVTKTKTERIAKEALYRELRALESVRAPLDAFPPIVANAFIQQQKAALGELQRDLAKQSENLGDLHPDIVRLRAGIASAESRIQAEIAKVLQSVRTEFNAAVNEEQGLMAVLETQKREALAMNRKGIEYGVLQRDAESNRTVYDSLLQRVKETGVSGELRASTIRIIDAADVPRTPVSPRMRRALLMAVLSGLVLGVSGAFFLEYLDSRIKTPEEIKTRFGLPSLGLVPAISRRELFDSAALGDSVPHEFSEAFQLVRTNLLFAGLEEPSRSLVVTSTGPGEGKTLVAANLAIELAQVGHRVLLVDADMRRPRLHEIFSVPRGPGLSDLVSGDSRAADAVRASGTKNLWVLTSGTRRAKQGELLVPDRFKAFLQICRDHFEWIVIDSPPVMGVADPSVLANAASGVLFVIGADRTPRRAVQKALEQLDMAHAKFVGGLLNRVDLKRNGYYYADYSPNGARSSSNGAGASA